MNYRSIADLSYCVRQNLHKLPADIDLVVGVPRSGSLVANMIALGLNLKMTDVEGYCADRPLVESNTRRIQRSAFSLPSEAAHVLVVDDSLASGKSMAQVKGRIEQLARAQQVTYCAVYVSTIETSAVDIYFEHLGDPRTFEWNSLHRPMLSRFCVDIDGVLCVDPTDDENDDGARYSAFLQSARPLALPSYPVGHFVTSRLECYRSATEQWLTQHGQIYTKLHMLDLPDAQTRRQMGCHATFKAAIYRKLTDTVLFIESDREQARKIAELSGKPAISFSTQEIFQPGLTYPAITQRSRTLAAKVVRAVKRVAGF
ncbi:MAG: phosphoribosyltransferase family protein [Gammaproteobacteria bacterium]|nr:phosphoribosyltransferase family protein [Gammaproteobacteria bacterium]